MIIIRYFFLACFLLFFSPLVHALTLQEELAVSHPLEVIQDQNSPDSLRIEACLSHAWDIKSSDPQEAIRLTQQAIELSEKSNRPSRTAYALSTMGVIYWQMGDFPMALDYQLEAQSIYLRLEEPLGLARTLINTGLIFSDQGHYDKALDYYFRCLSIHEKLENKRGMAPVLNNIGRVYQHQEDYEMAQNYYLRSLDIKKEINDRKGIAYSLNSLGEISQRQGHHELALEYFKQALAIRQELQDQREIASTLSNIGYLFLQSDSLVLSADYLHKALALYNGINDQGGLAKTFNYLGKVYIRRNNLQRASRFVNRSLEISRRIGLARMVLENYNTMAELMALQGNYQNAYLFQSQFNALRDSVSSSESQRRMGEIKLLYDREKKEQEIELLQKTNQISSLNFEKQRIQKNFLLALVILVLALLFLLYNRFLAINNANKQLELQKNEIYENNQKLLRLNKDLMEQKQKVDELNQKLSDANVKLSESEQHLINTNRTKDKFFSIISHDLRNPFASIVSFSRILKREIQSLSKEDLREMALELDKSVLKINNLLENLLQWSRAQTGKINYHPEYIALKDVVDEIMNLFKGNARDKDIGISDRIEDNLVVFADMNMTNTVIRNLVSNALKYTEPGGRIELSAWVDQNMVKISVADNGVGISPENISKLFRVDTLHTTFGTSDEKGSGLGLLLCKEFVEKQGGEISLESTEGEGTVFTFSLPLENPHE